MGVLHRKHCTHNAHNNTHTQQHATTSCLSTITTRSATGPRFSTGAQTGLDYHLSTHSGVCGPARANRAYSLTQPTPTDPAPVAFSVSWSMPGGEQRCLLSAQGMQWKQQKWKQQTDTRTPRRSDSPDKETGDTPECTPTRFPRDARSTPSTLATSALLSIAGRTWQPGR